MEFSGIPERSFKEIKALEKCPLKGTKHVIYQSITAMADYESLSFEEIRLQDYILRGVGGREYGTRIVGYKPRSILETTEKNGKVEQVATKLCNVTGLYVYANKSFEELRLEDYNSRKIGNRTLQYNMEFQTQLYPNQALTSKFDLINLTGGTPFPVRLVPLYTAYVSSRESQDQENMVELCKQKLIELEIEEDDTHPDYAVVLVMLAVALRDKKSYNEALIHAKEAMRVRKLNFVSDHKIFISTHNTLAELYELIGNAGQAEKHYRTALRMREKLSGSGHPELAQQLLVLGEFLVRQGNIPHATNILDRALLIYEREYGTSAEGTVRTRKCLCQLYTNAAYHALAKEYEIKPVYIKYTADSAGTYSVKFNPPVENIREISKGKSVTIQEKYICITAMKEYKEKSLEELRFADYLLKLNNKIPSQIDQNQQDAVKKFVFFDVNETIVVDPTCTVLISKRVASETKCISICPNLPEVSFRIGCILEKPNPGAISKVEWFGNVPKMYTLPIGQILNIKIDKDITINQCDRSDILNSNKYEVETTKIYIVCNVFINEHEKVSLKIEDNVFQGFPPIEFHEKSRNVKLFDNNRKGLIVDETFSVVSKECLKPKQELIIKGDYVKEHCWIHFSRPESGLLADFLVPSHQMQSKKADADEIKIYIAHDKTVYINHKLIVMPKHRYHLVIEFKNSKIPKPSFISSCIGTQSTRIVCVVRTLELNRLVVHKNRFNSLLNSQDINYFFTAVPIEVGHAYVIHVQPRILALLNPRRFEVGVTSCNPNSIDLRFLPVKTVQLADRSEFWLSFGNFMSKTAFVVGNGRVTSQGGLNGEWHIPTDASLWMFVYHNETINYWRGETTQNVDSAVVESHAVSQPTQAALETTELEALPRLQALPELGPITLPDLGTLNLKTEKSQAVPTKSTNRGQLSPASTSRDTRKKEEVDSNKECIICCTEEIDCAIIMCGHCCMCYKCAKEFMNRGGGQCPVCRKKIQNVIKLYK